MKDRNKKCGSRYPVFNRDILHLKPLEERCHDLHVDTLLPLQPVSGEIGDELARCGQELQRAKARGRSSVLMIGAHVLRDGVQHYIIDLMERGLISCLAMNGAGAIHDFEFAAIGATTESVARYIENGEFGLWQETGMLNRLADAAADANKGAGEVIGQYIEEQRLPFRNISVLAAGWRLGIPVTVHVSIGCDIIHEHANCNGASWGQASYTDFLIYTRVLQDLAGGIVMNFGSAVMGPEIFLKALAMVRNQARQQGREIGPFTSLVCDLKKLPESYRQEADKSDPSYYFRPWKTMLVRTTKGAGKSYYVRGRHRHTLPELWTAATDKER